MSSRDFLVPFPRHLPGVGPKIGQVAALFRDEELGGWHGVVYRCFMIVMWIALASFFVLVVYNTLFVTPLPASETPVHYRYLTPGG